MVKENTSMPCAYLEGTTGTQCVLYLARIRGFPSKAKMANETLETPGGPIYNHPFYLCQPALDWKIANETGTKTSLDSLIEEQQQCSHYGTERKTPILQRWHKVTDRINNFFNR